MNPVKDQYIVFVNLNKNHATGNTSPRPRLSRLSRRAPQVGRPDSQIVG